MELQFTRKTQYYHPVAKTNIPINLDWPERYASLLAGVSLLSSGVKHVITHPLSNIFKSVAGGYLVFRGLTGHCPLYRALGKYNATPVNVNIRKTFTVNRPRKEVYAFWHQLDNLPRFMQHLESVTLIDGKRSHWEVRLPSKLAKISWDAEIVEEQEDFLIGWQSLPGAMIYNAGKVEFKDTPDGLGTILNVVISYTLPAGGVGTAVGRLLNPVFEKIVNDDVLNLKSYLETQGVPPELIHHAMNN